MARETPACEREQTAQKHLEKFVYTMEEISETDIDAVRVAGRSVSVTRLQAAKKIIGNGGERFNVDVMLVPTGHYGSATELRKDAKDALESHCLPVCDTIVNYEFTVDKEYSRDPPLCIIVTAQFDFSGV